MFPTYLIGLREGLEASLVVGILVAYLVKTGRGAQLRTLWGGIGAAVGISLAFGALLQFTSAGLSFRAQEAFGGFASLLAVGFVTWMVFWMRRTARFLKTELHGRLETALTLGPLALALTAFVAVGREGLETALFLWAAVQSTQQSVSPIAGALLGLLTSVALGYLLYRRAVHLNLETFFTWTGAALVLVAAGVFSYGTTCRRPGCCPVWTRWRSTSAARSPVVLVRRAAQGCPELLGAHQRVPGGRLGLLRRAGARAVPAAVRHPEPSTGGAQRRPA